MTECMGVKMVAVKFLIIYQWLFFSFPQFESHAKDKYHFQALPIVHGSMFQGLKFTLPFYIQGFLSS